MKTLFSLLAGCLLAVSAFAGTIKIKVNGSQQVQVVFDGVTYNSSDYANDEMLFSNLSAGPHTVVIYRMNNRGRAKQIYSSTISLDENKEIHLTIGANGSISREEFTSNEAFGRTAMSEASFNQILNSVRNQWGQAAKLSVARDEFNTEANYFTTNQVSRIIQLINSEAGRLELAKLSYDNVTDPGNFTQIYSLLNSQNSRNELEDYVSHYDDDANTGYKTAMSSVNFNQVYQNINSRKGTSRLNSAKASFNSTSNYFDVAQVSQLISLFTNESQRLLLAKLSLDNIVDMQNVEQLFNLFSTQANKDAFDLYIRNNGFAGTDYSYTSRAAMSDASYNSLYESIRKKWLPLGKFSAARDAFNTASNYFTTAQAKQIISLLSSESNRLELAKLAFDNIVDQQNFREMYDLFSETSQAELDKYITDSRFQ